MVTIGSFCGLLSLQVGLVILSAIHLTLGVCMILINFFYFIINNGYVYIIVILLSALMLVSIGISLFFTSYSENSTLSRWTCTIVLLHLLYWFVLCVISFNGEDEHLKYVCAGRLRCAESLWIVDLEYRHKAMLCYPTENPQSATVGVNTTNLPNNIEDTNALVISKFPDDFIYKCLYDKSRNDTQVVTYIVSTFNMIGAIVLFIAILCFFIFTAIIVWHYGIELEEVETLDQLGKSVKVVPPHFVTK